MDRTSFASVFLLSVFSLPAWSAYDQLRINEVMAGYNGDSSVQFVEILAPVSEQRQWGPVDAETVGRVGLYFYNAKGNQTGRYIFNSSPSTSSGPILVATQSFSNLPGAPVPDFIMPPEVVANAGKVCIRNNPDNLTANSFSQCVSYGSYVGTPGAEGAPLVSSLPITGAAVIARNANFAFDASTSGNIDFRISTPTPANTAATSVDASQNVVAGGTTNFVADSLVNQGRTLFEKETFGGNGRTCQTCHLPPFFNMTPQHVHAKADSDPLFVFRPENNINQLVVSSEGSVTHFSQPGDLRGTITDESGNVAVVKAGTGNVYTIVGGSNLNGLITDSFGNIATFSNFQAGNLNGPNVFSGSPHGLEDSNSDKLMRSNDPAFPEGRALILENIDGFDKAEVFRKSTHLLNIKDTAPYGMSADFSDLKSFTLQAVRQHFTRKLGRREGIDFVLPTSGELSALVAFQESIKMDLESGFRPLGTQSPFLFRPQLFDELPLGNATTYKQLSGAVEFIGLGCIDCHAGRLMNEIVAPFNLLTPVNTGVANQQINLSDDLPSEPPSAGAGSSNRNFSIPPLVGVRHTSPYFHDGSVATLEGVVDFYNSNEFKASSHLGLGGVLNSPSPSILDAAKSSLVEFLNSLAKYPFDFTSGKYFGFVEKGGSRSEPFTITNHSDKPLTFTKVNLLMGDKTSRTRERIPNLPSGFILPGGSADPYVKDQFVISPNLKTVEIPPHESFTFNISFSPTIAGAQRFGQLELQIKAGEELWDFAIRLVGESSTFDDRTPPTLAGPILDVQDTMNATDLLVPITITDTVESAPLQIEAWGVLTRITRPSFVDNAGGYSFTGDLVNSSQDLPVGENLQQGTVVDTSGNILHWSRRVTFVDTTPPSIFTLSEFSVSTNAAVLHSDIPLPSVNDRVGIASIVHDGPDVFPTGDTTITWTATDLAGNQSTQTQIVRVVRLDDVTPPVFTSLPLPIVNAEASGKFTYLALARPAVTDNGNIVLTPTLNNPGPYPLGDTELIWSVVDFSGNSATTTQTIHVRDTIAPFITSAPTFYFEATDSYSSITLPNVLASDIVEVISIANNAPEQFPLGRTDVTWTAEDSSGNKSTFIQAVVVRDSTAPQFSGINDIIVNATSVKTTINLSVPTVTDAIGVVDVYRTPATNEFPIGETVITWRAKDAAGNEGVATQKVLVQDARTFALIKPADKTVEASGIQTSVTLSKPGLSGTMTDVTITSNAPVSFPVGDTVVTWTGIDVLGNTSYIQQTVSVVDTTAPVIGKVGNVQVEATGPNTPVVLVSPSATDSVGVKDITHNGPAQFPLGETLVTWTAKDVAGNVASKQMKVMVVDTTAPLMTAPVDINVKVYQEGVSEKVNLAAPTALDVVGIASVTHNAPSAFPVGETLVSWLATDTSGNSTTVLQKVVVEYVPEQVVEVGSGGGVVSDPVVETGSGGSVDSSVQNQDASIKQDSTATTEDVEALSQSESKTKSTFFGSLDLWLLFTAPLLMITRRRRG